MAASDRMRMRAEAKAYAQAEDWGSALPLWQMLAHTEPYDGRVWDGLAEARMKLGDYEGARHAYEKVRAYGVYDHDRIVLLPGVTSCLIAACHAACGDTDAALAALATAMREGFAAVDRLGDVPELAAVRSDPRYAEVLGIEDVQGLERHAGWRLDLQVILREARRRRPIPFADDEWARLERDSGRLHDDIPEFTDEQIVAAMTRLLASLGDGHAYLEAPADHKCWSRALPVQLYLFEEGLFVVSAATAYQSLLGTEIRALDGAPVQSVLTAIDPLIPRDNELRSRELAPQMLRKTALLHGMGLIRDPHKVVLTTPRGDVTVPAEPGNDPRLPHFPFSRTMRQYHENLQPAGTSAPLYLRDPASNYWFEYLTEHRAVYFQFNAIADEPDEPLETFSDRLATFVNDHDVDRLVVDLRWNGGGNTLLTAPLLRRIAGARGLDHPGGILMIVGRRTFSAAGNLAKFLQWLAGPNLTVVGEPTGSSLEFIGETVRFTLPYSGLLCNISNLYWQGTTPLDRRSWIAPDIYTPPTFAAYANGRDPAMEAILELISHSNH